MREAVLSSREDATVIHLFTTDVPTDIAFSVQVPRSAVALQDHLVALLSASSPPAGGSALGSGGLGSEATPASPPDLDLAASGPARRSLVDWASGWVMKEFRRGGGVDGSLVLVFRPGRSTENPDRLRLPTTDRRAAVSLAAAEQAHAERLVVLTGGNEHGGRLAVWVDVYDLQNGQAAAFVLHWKNTRRGPELLGLTGRRSDLDRALELSDRG
ncbi:hypothetical protein [Nocardioides flavescens]|uniref:Uncharacterized protein n=1 Tax=Nocardioides flavescens TaxID=2691959 RepID=A0A6L7EYP1_9ACTN|nr:hypothetical protein [Nocardioides flavescens]MXG91196.1 hypothetical protein [Nocardioides flavescens]